MEGKEREKEGMEGEGCERFEREMEDGKGKERLRFRKGEIGDGKEGKRWESLRTRCNGR